jgi:hypothetical protein
MSAAVVLTQPVADLLSDGTLGIEQAMEFSGLGRSLLYELMGCGRLPYSKVGARRVIPKRALMKILAEGLSGEATKS